MERLGFLALYQPKEREGYLGALLITDEKGVPLEFRCTHPVKPTAIQKPLYGTSLEPHIGITLTGLPLLQSVQQKPSLLIVQKDYLLEIRKASPCPVVFMRRSGEAIEVKSPDDIRQPKRERIDCPSGRFQPLVITVNPDFRDDSAASRAILESVFGAFDPLEPFERIYKALDALATQDGRFK